MQLRPSRPFSEERTKTLSLKEYLRLGEERVFNEGRFRMWIGIPFTIDSRGKPASEAREHTYFASGFRHLPRTKVIPGITILQRNLLKHPS